MRGASGGGSLMLATIVFAASCAGCLVGAPGPGQPSSSGAETRPTATSMEAAAGTRLASVCGKLPSGEEKASCLGMAENDSKACRKLEAQADRDRCYMRMGDYLLDAGICGNISDGNMHDMCLTTVASETGEPGPCERCGNRFNRIRCLAEAGRDPSLCAQLLKQDMRTICAAYAGDDPSLCGEIEENAFRDDCRTRFASKRKDPTYCKDVENPSVAAMCISFAATDAALCEAISDDSLRVRCGAVVGGDPSVCDQLNDPESWAGCMRFYVRAQVDYYD
jgi:hypothetical protein